MRLKVFLPAKELQPFIKCYYLSESQYTDFVEDVFYPDGCVEVVFHFGLDFYRGEEKESWAKVIGQITKPLTMNATGIGKSFGIWFWPHTFSHFSEIPLHEINDSAIPLDTIFSNGFIDLVKNSVLEHDVETLVAQTNRFLTRKLHMPKNAVREKIASYAVQYILKEKAASDLDKLAWDCGVSNRNLQKIFNERVGFSPKFLIRIVRFQSTLKHLASGKFSSLTDLTYQSGYYDQAHFIREFKEFTRLSPSQFHTTEHPINQYFLNL